MAADGMLALLADALHATERWVRLGAMQALAAEGDARARPYLEQVWSGSAPASHEQWDCLVALESLAVDCTPRLTQLAGLSSAAELDPVFGPSYDAWVRWDRAHLSIPSYGRFALSRIRDVRRAPRPPAQKPDSPAYAAVGYELRSRLSLMSVYAGKGSAQEKSAHRLLDPILRDLAAADSASQQNAVASVTRLALTEPDEFLHPAVARGLAALPTPDVRAPLLQALEGDPPALPSPERIRAMAGPGSTARFDLLTSDLAIHLASQTLAEFADDETAWAVVERALTAQPDTQARAGDVLSRMRREASLPALFYAALNSAAWSERRRAETLLDDGVTLRDRLAFYRVAGRDTRADLRWLSELLRAARVLPPWALTAGAPPGWAWTQRRDAVQRLLRQAILLAAFSVGEVGFNAQDASAWHKLVDYVTRTARQESAVRQVRQASEPITRARRYAAVDFPAQCLLGSKTPLRVGLTVEASAKSVDASEVEVQFGPGQSSARLVVMVYAPAFDVSERWLPLVVPLAADSAQLEFWLTPTIVGRQTIEIEFVRDAERCGYVQFATDVVAEGAPPGQVSPQVLDTASNEDLLRRGQTRAVIYVEWQPGVGLSYRVLDPAQPSPALADAGMATLTLRSDQSRITKAEAQAWVAKQHDIIQDYLKPEYDKDELDSALAGLAGIGHSLREQLVPREVIEQARAWASGSIIAIDTNECWIPWELLHDGPGGAFWGERFQLVRVPRAQPDAAPVTAPLPPEGVPAGCAEVGKILSVVGDEVSDYNTKRTFGSARPYVKEIVEETFKKLQSEMADADIVHFMCHGRSDPLYHLSLGPGPARRLLVSTVALLPVKPGGVVFANACSSSQPELLLTSLENFGWEFFLRGARPFIGTLGPVPTQHAIDFAECFYKYFLLQGLPVGQAMREARREMQQQNTNPFWLFYGLYGPASSCWRLRAN